MSDKIELVEVECCNCKNKFHKTVHRYRQYIKCDWNFFCSKECQGQFKNNSKKLKCFKCEKDIFVLRNVYDNSVSKRFFCSHSCSAKVSNRDRGPKTPIERNNIKRGLVRHYTKLGRLRDKLCAVCGKTFKSTSPSHLCCSRNCHSIYKFGSLPYTKDDVVNIITNIGITTKRTPQKRDCETKLYHAAVRLFGTWNKTMGACNLKPNHSKFSKIRLKCLDGHISDSISEKIIDDWLCSNNIKHEKNKKYPKSNMNCDFYLVDHDIWVEYYGLIGSSCPDYDNTIKLKEALVKENNLNFMSIKPNDLYDDKITSYDDKLKKMFCKILTT